MYNQVQPSHGHLQAHCSPIPPTNLSYIVNPMAGKPNLLPVETSVPVKQSIESVCTSCRFPKIHALKTLPPSTCPLPLLAKNYANSNFPTREFPMLPYVMLCIGTITDKRMRPGNPLPASPTKPAHISKTPKVPPRWS